MTDFERKYFGRNATQRSGSNATASAAPVAFQKKQHPLQSQQQSQPLFNRGLLTRTNSNVESSSAGIGNETPPSDRRTSSLRRNGSAVKKEVNFLSPTKTAQHSTTLPHNFTLNMAPQSPAINGSRYSHQSRQELEKQNGDRGDNDMERDDNARHFRRRTSETEDKETENIDPSYYSDSTTASREATAAVSQLPLQMGRNKCFAASSLSLSNIDRARLATFTPLGDDGAGDGGGDSNDHWPHQSGTMRSIRCESRATSQSQLATTTTMTRNGSLRRSKGRSNQSLCSCDADTEVRYSGLEVGRKGCGRYD